MKYTKYFAQVNKDAGLQRISRSQLARIMNIVYIEGRKRGIKETTDLVERDKSSRNSMVLMAKMSRRMAELTGNREPRAVMQEICYISEREQ